MIRLKFIIEMASPKTMCKLLYPLARMKHQAASSETDAIKVILRSLLIGFVVVGKDPLMVLSRDRTQIFQLKLNKPVEKEEEQEPSVYSSLRDYFPSTNYGSTVT